ncbi:tyrosine-type recombinase/integrase [Streptomyces parvus]|uniref:tyrosine-type recombinase/integrase n=1 Tax=Streptomyces parvus TaxID=66428 RepID=UPI0021015AA6|nr:hypothetical protein [Streptomyces parvus]MCQ1579269.1 hypothetical protein [Streptomyces parvus]
MGVCPECRAATYQMRQGKLREEDCLRCGWLAIVGADGTCRCCRAAVRLGEDPAWLRAVLERRLLPAGRPLQLALRMDGLRLKTLPLRQTRPLTTVKLPSWARGRPAELQDDPCVCVTEVPGQLGLFAPCPRSFTREHGTRIRGRTPVEWPIVLAELKAIAAERGVGETWLVHTGDGARLALASRPPTERLVSPEALVDLPQMRPTVQLVLQRAGLLARPRPRLVPGWWSKGRGSCRDCLAWTNGNDQRCRDCQMWGHTHADGPCHRCGRGLPLRDGHCRRCLLLLAETEYDLDHIALEGGDQLWFGGPYAPHLKTTTNRAGEQTGLYGRRRLQTKRRIAVQTSRATAHTVSEHLAIPGQLLLFHALRDWSRLDGRPLPALTPNAEALLADFTSHIRARGWTLPGNQASLSALKFLVAHLGADAPFHETDVRLLAHHPNFAAPRVINYLRAIGLLVPDEKSDALLATARRYADEAPAAFQDGVHRWIDVMCNAGTRPSLPLAPSTVHGYVRRARTCLNIWHTVGIDDLRAITADHITTVLDTLTGETRKTTATAVRSLFRALKREKLIFRDPTRGITLTVAIPLPKALPDERLVGALDLLPFARDKLSLTLAAVHALGVHDQRGLLLDDLDRARGRLTVRRAGRLDRTIYLDELTHQLIKKWLAERHRRWPSSTNPHLLVTARTSADDNHPKVHPRAISKPLSRIGLQPGRLRMDRILDEATHTEDPVHLIRLFGLSPITAMRYVRAAHPDRYRPLPIAP